MPALIYAAKVARTPYMTPAGPDALDLNLSEPIVQRGDPVTLTAVLNDTRFKGVEPTQNIAAGEVYINVPPWLEDQNPQPLPMEPADGQFNSPIETATITLDTSDLEGGQHILFVRGQDSAGNWGAFSAVFLEVLASELEHIKTASHDQAFAGEVIDYAISQTLSYFEGVPVTQTITDSLPAELVVITDSIYLNGEPAPDLYNADTHQIVYEWSGIPESNQNTFTITYQAQVDPLIDQIIETYNVLESAAEVDGEALPAPDPVIVNLTVFPAPLLAHSKNASAIEAIPGEIITYTLTQELTLPGEFTITYGLKDTLPPELIVLVETIHLNGQPAPELYDPDQHTISFSDIGNYEGMTEITITYQVQIDPEITEAIEIANEIESQAEIGDYLLQAPEPVIFNLSVLEAPQLTHSKTANTTEAVPGDIITYTLTQQLALPKDLLVTHSLTDTLPPELIVLTETIQLDGQPAPELYDPDEHTIVYSQTGTFDGITVTITYQAQINAEIMLDIDLENLLTSQASVNAVQVSAPEPVIESVHVTPVIWHFYIPITIRN
jgi:fimbrial isopeptide formation D2 family protein